MVEAWDRELRNLLATGRVSTTDNVIDPVTGTIKLKAEFANADGSLFPNQFVNVKLQINTLEAALAVPSAAVQRGAIGTFVYVVKPDNAVTMRRVRTGATEGDLVSVTGELEAGERVVTDGADRLREGAKVEVITPPARFGPGGPGGGAPGARREGGGGSSVGGGAGGGLGAVASPGAGAGTPAPAPMANQSRNGATPMAGPEGGPSTPRPNTGAATTNPVQAGPPAQAPVAGAPNSPTPAPAAPAAQPANAAWISQLPPEAQERVRMVLERIGPEMAAKVHKMSPEERRAFFQQLRAQAQRQQQD